MTTRITWLGHGGWSLTDGKHHILIDPFLSASPVAPCSAESLAADFILISHGHFDHIADAAAIARRTGALVVANFEIATWLEKHHGVEKTLGMNLGGRTRLPFGTLQLTIAWHSSQLPDGSYGGNPGGFLLDLNGQRWYFACDTGLFSDMRLYAQPRLDVAVLPIGDLFTMGPDESIEAVKLLQPVHVLPAHYNTWPPIAQDAQAWARRVREQTQAQPVVLAPGEIFELPRGSA